MAEAGAQRRRSEEQEQSQTQQHQGQQQQQGSVERRSRGREGSSLSFREEFFPSLFSLSPREFFTLSPFSIVRRFTEEMDRAFSSFGLSRGFEREGVAWLPAVEVRQSGNNLIVSAELPGLSQEDVKVEASEEGLVIQGERKREHEEEREGFHHSERSYGHFYRRIPLPEDAKVNQATAQFNNGILEVTISVSEKQRRRRQIPIAAGGEKRTPTASERTEGTESLEGRSKSRAASSR